MKVKIFVLLLVSSLNLSLFGQDLSIKFVCYYGENSHPNLACLQMQHSLMSPISAATALKKILTPLGLAPNFVMVPCSGIRNCAALTLSDGFRYIVYDQYFMDQIAQTSKSNWTDISILAHEIGHHLQGHTMRASSLEESRMMELQADKFSGFVLQKLGASLSDAEAAMNVLNHPYPDTYSDHPSKDKRLKAIEEGYNESLNLSTTLPSIPDGSVGKSDAVGMTINDIVRAENNLSLADSWKKGFNCRSLCYGEGYYYAFMEKNFGSWQEFINSDVLPDSIIKKGWNMSPGTIISSVNFVNGKWAILMTKFSTNFIGQKYINRSYFPSDEIKKEWDDNYRIIDEDFGNGVWLFVMNKICPEFNLSEQMYNRYNDFPASVIKDYWDKGYYITSLKYLDNQWLLVMSKYPGRTGLQRYNTNPNFPMDDLIKNDHEGFSFSSVTYGKDTWVSVMEILNR